jgi:CheY-like chemotaxis protein
VLDMMLPKLSGLDVLRALKGDALVKNIPVIVMSGFGQGNESKTLEGGCRNVPREIIGFVRERFTGFDSVVANSADGSKGLTSHEVNAPGKPVASNGYLLKPRQVSWGVSLGDVE